MTDTGPISFHTPADPATAWRELLALTPESARSGRLRLGEVEIRFDPTGDWQASERLPPETAQLLDLYLPLRLAHTLTIAQMGQSLDGRIATRTGHSHFVTGREDIVHLHRLRALVDAVVVGPGTVAADNPRLTVRHVEGRNPVRVLLDPTRRLTADRHAFADGAAPTLLCHLESAAGAALPGHVERLPLPGAGTRLDPAEVIRALRSRGFRRILVEGGGLTVSRFLAEGQLDRLHVTVTPMIIGSGIPAFTLPPVDVLDHALRPVCRQFSLGEDRLFDFVLNSGASPPGRLPSSTITP